MMFKSLLSKTSNSIVAHRRLTATRSLFIGNDIISKSLIKPTVDDDNDAERSNRSQTRSMTILSQQSAEDYKKQNYSERMKKTGRPVSPHVTIYSFPITALSSITNRVTGIALSGGCFTLASLELLSGSGSSLELMQYVGNDGGMALSLLAKSAVGFSFSYHYLGGLRHYIWDNKPDVLNTEGAEKSSYALIGGSVLATLGLLVI